MWSNQIEVLFCNSIREAQAGFVLSVVILLTVLISIAYALGLVGNSVL